MRRFPIFLLLLSSILSCAGCSSSALDNTPTEIQREQTVSPSKSDTSAKLQDSVGEGTQIDDANDSTSESEPDISFGNQGEQVASEPLQGEKTAPTETDLARPEHTTLVVDMDGESVDVSATLQTDIWYDRTFSLYIPDSWSKDGYATWYADNEGDVSLYIECWPGDENNSMKIQRCHDEIKKKYGSDVDFEPMEGNSFSGVQSDRDTIRQVWLTECGNDCWAVFGIYPSSAKERFELAVVAKTFEATKSHS